MMSQTMSQFNRTCKASNIEHLIEEVEGARGEMNVESLAEEVDIALDSMNDVERVWLRE